jgi:iron-sulfur cluster assembly accessory protein
MTNLFYKPLRSAQEPSYKTKMETFVKPMRPPPLSLTPNAAARLHALSAAQGKPIMLRVAVDGGGCSGFQYRFDLVEAPEPDDHQIERDGAFAVVDDVSVALLAGSEIDFVDELAGAEFRVKNPNARTSCGCGVSFSI